jgi:hypothetical protein
VSAVVASFADYVPTSEDAAFVEGYDQGAWEVLSSLRKTDPEVYEGVVSAIPGWRKLMEDADAQERRPVVAQ